MLMLCVCVLVVVNSLCGADADAVCVCVLVVVNSLSGADADAVAVCVCVSSHGFFPSARNNTLHHEYFVH